MSKTYLETIEKLQSLRADYEHEGSINKLPEITVLKNAEDAIISLTQNRGPKRAIAASILDVFENLLEKHNVTIPDEDREGAEEEARLYGGTYFELEDKIVEILTPYIQNQVDENGNEILE